MGLLREVRNDRAYLLLRMAWWRLPRWWWWCLAYPSGMASELVLQFAPHRLVLRLAHEGALLQRLWALRGLHHVQPELLALLKQLRSASTEGRVFFDTCSFLRTLEVECMH